MISVLSNIAFPVAGHGHPITLIAGIFLCLASGWMHLRPGKWSTLSDWFFMYAFSLSVLSVITTYWVLALLIPIAYLRSRMISFRLIGLVVLLTVAIAQSWLALVCFAVAFAVRQTVDGDVGHGLFHIMAAAGYWVML